MTHSVKKRNLFLVLSLILAACGTEKPEVLIASAQSHIEQKDFRTAVIELKNALQTAPASAEGRFLLGRALLEGGDPVAAEVELRKAADLKYPEERIAPLLAQAMLNQGLFKKLREAYAGANYADAKTQANVLTSLAIGLAGEDRLPEAKVTLEKALTLDPDYPVALLTAARLKAASKDFAGASKLVDQVLAKETKHAEAYKLRGDIFRVQGKSAEALLSYQGALAAKENFLPAHHALIIMALDKADKVEARKQFDALKKIAAQDPNTGFLDARILLLEGSLKEAREQILQLLKVAPDNSRILELAGVIEFRMKGYRQAENYLAKALQIAPDLPEGRRLLIASYLRTGQPGKAMASLQTVLPTIQNDPNMLALAGEVYLQNADLQKAESYFAKSAQLDPKDAGKRTSLALARLLKGNDLALGELADIATSDSGTAADMALISATMRRKEFDKALKAIAVLEKKQPTDPVAADLRGRVFLEKGLTSEARSSFESALKLNPAYLPSIVDLARLDIANKKPELARQRYESVLSGEPGNTQALAALADLSEKQGESAAPLIARVNKVIAGKSAEPALHVLLVNLYLRNKESKKAVAVAQDAVAAIPDAPELYEVLGAAQREVGDNYQAINAYTKQAGLQPGSPLPHLRIAQLYMADKNSGAAEKSLRKALELKPDLFEAQRGLALIELDAGRTSAALALARDVQKQRPDQALGYLLEGDIAVAKQQWDVAANAYRGGLRNAASIELAVKLNKTLLAGGKAAEAEKFSADWLKAHPREVAYRLHLGDMALARKQPDQAATLFKAVLEIEPDNVIALNNMAYILATQDSAKALEYAEKANRLAPNQPALIDTLAMVLAEKGEFRRAVELMRQVLTLDPKLPLFRFNLAKILIKAGDKAEARKELEILAKLGEKFPAQSQVSSLMNSL